MKKIYRGFELEANREKSLAGEFLVFYSIFRARDQWELDSGFSYGTIPDKIADMESTVNDYIENPEDYDD